MRSSLLTVLALVVPISSNAGPIVFSAAGADAVAIQATVDSFRATLGTPNNGNAPGPLPSGRREINWDGGGTNTSPVPTPFTGFQANRGALFTTPGTGFLQAPPTGGSGGGLATFFGNATYGTIFTTFSPQRLFAPTASNITDATFFVPGLAIVATISGFGAVFSDVDLANTTTLQFFNPNGNSLGTFSAPTFNNGLSFLGVAFDAGELVSRVRITTGNTALGPNDGGGVDVVAMDDFLFSEPQRAVPEPASLALLGLGLVGLAAIRRKRA